MDVSLILVLAKNSFDELVRVFPMDFVGWETNPFLSGIPELFPDLD